MMEARLRMLRITTQRVLDEWKPCDRTKDAVNWADLNVVEVAWVQTEDRSYLQVTVDEVSPDAAEFQESLIQRLAAQGWPDVEVVTEW